MQILQGKNSWHLVNSLFLLSALYLFCCGCSAEDIPGRTVQQPAVAGAFYPAAKGELDSMVQGFLEKAKSDCPAVTGEIFGLISPHAGYIYSGPVAAYGYSAVAGMKFTRVIVMAPTHYVLSRWIATISPEAFATPLGEIPVDRELVNRLTSEVRLVKVDPQSFAKEHSLEAQLPFLQKVLGNFKLVPLVFGAVDIRECDEIARKLADILQEEPGKTLIVASSDMSHYLTADQGNAMDKLALDLTVKLDADKLWASMSKEECQYCGASDVVTMLLIAKKLGASVKVLKYGDSGDATGDKRKVVGYGSVAFYQESPVLPVSGSSLKARADTVETAKRIQNNTKEVSVDMLSENERKKLLKMARETLESYIRDKKVPKFEVTEEVLTRKCGVFVTLKKQGELRGCIGYLVGVKPLNEAVVDMAINSSTRDPRFSPVMPDELSEITIEISVMTPLVKVLDVNEIEVGKHGLVIKRGWNSGLLLPQVAPEWGWNREQFLQHTCSKAGLPTDAWKQPGTEIQSFTAQVFSEDKP
ncbi:MAG: AmmeMemoRadiSam system protein B [Candidatus Wallbacteria bacterium]|nr:AmmeMemoRadiSam system protein B [Candidatus Wallbacteria bacterium]